MPCAASARRRAIEGAAPAFLLSGLSREVATESTPPETIHIRQKLLTEANG